MSEGELAYTRASMPVLRWLTDAGPRVPAGIRDRLLAKPFTSPVAVLLGVLNGLILNATAVFLQHGAAFAWFMGLDLLLSACFRRCGCWCFARSPLPAGMGGGRRPISIWSPVFSGPRCRVPWPSPR